MNYYELLEVSPKASEAVIRAAYKSLMQRYHPDKNPGSAEAAERASLVVQAYEVLSNADKRSAYDRELGGMTAQRASSIPATPLGRANNAGWRPTLIVAATIAISLAAMRQWNSTTSPAPVIPTPPRVESAAAAMLDERATIPALITGLEVKLSDRAEDGDRRRILTIPVVGIGVGPRDAQLAIKHLNNIADQIRDKLTDRLESASFDELLKPDGERYLKALILAIVTESSGTTIPADESASNPQKDNRYGAIAVLLPSSYSVH